MIERTSDSFSCEEGDPFYRKYEVVTLLRQGRYGTMYKCFNKDTKETCAVKFRKQFSAPTNELEILKYMQTKNLDECNIVRFIESHRIWQGTRAIVYETLDVTLSDCIQDCRPLNLRDVRSVVQQLATALNALKAMELIHANIKLSNIMVLDRTAQPLRVKLIDFTLAFPTCRADEERNKTHQAMGYRAPEVFLGLPFSEAIDMWSLGAVTLALVCGYGPLWTSSKYETIRQIVEWLGAPPDHLLDVGMKTEKYFLREDSGHWRLKTHYEHSIEVIVPKICVLLNFQDGRHLENLLQKNINTVEEDEKSQCIDLVKAMLRVDPNERIIPSDVLAHPFITRGTLHIGRKEEGRENVEEELESKTLTTGPFEIPPGVILVKPSPTTCVLTLDGLESKTFTNETPGTPSAPPSVPFVQAPCESSGAPSAHEECSSVTSGFHGSASETSPPGVMLVQPAPAECCLQGDEDSRQSDSCPVDCLENISENGPVEPSSLLATDCNVEQELAATTSDNTAPEEKQQKKQKKKRKNCFKRFLAWTKRTFCCCLTVNVEED